jgi:hypothetical protein
VSRSFPKFPAPDAKTKPQRLENTRLARLACGLLCVVAVTLSACPIPDFEVDPGLNSPISVLDELVVPPEGVLSATRTDPSLPVEFYVENALSDPDGDRLFTFWYVDYDPGEVGLWDASETFDFTFDPCTHPKAGFDSAESVLVEAIVMDRPPAGFDAAGARETTEDGDLVRLFWVIEIAEGNACAL